MSDDVAEEQLPGVELTPEMPRGLARTENRPESNRKCRLLAESVSFCGLELRQTDRHMSTDGGGWGDR